MMIFFILTTILFLFLWRNEKNRAEKQKISANKEKEELEKSLHDCEIELKSQIEHLNWVIKEKENTIENQRKNYERQLDQKESEAAFTLKQKDSEIDRLTEKYGAIVDAEAESSRILAEARENAQNIRIRAQRAEEQASNAARISQKTAEQIISDAKAKAEEIAGDAIKAQGKAQEYEQTAAAMKRIIQGYGDEWLKPSYSLLDELAEEFGYTEAGQKLKEARAISARMVTDKTAANCNYSDHYRRQTAIQFVIDAFNGKVDSILSKAKQDNYGILEQKIKDSYYLVNKNGVAFQNAHITETYLNARLDELKWATIVQELKKKAQDEQRALREKMREEEKARREYEKAQREAAKEEAMLQKAMEKAKAMLAAASEEQKAKYEAQIAEFEVKLKEAEEKNQRALSMAQQTKRGTVYIISNVGSFGENVYKVGMTRRLDPIDRVKELGDASVPFPFDVHAFIESDDAPALETALHHDLAITQMNKVNPRKEFFRADIASIKALVESKGLTANWTMSAEAAEYRESLAIDKKIKDDPVEYARWQKFTDSEEIDTNE